MNRPDALHRAILDALFDGVAYLNKNLRILFWNTAAERTSGYLAKEMTAGAMDLSLLEDGAGRGIEERSDPPIKQTLEDGRPRKLDAFVRHKHGHRIPAGVRTTPLRNEDGDIQGVVVCFWDASHARDEDERVAHLQRENLLDPLTGVGNRRYADQVLALELENLRRRDMGLGLLFVDIDHFKRVNDTYGHVAGDKVLTAVAATLSRSLRSYDAVARWGGEEFLVILPRIQTVKRLEQVAERLRALVEGATVQDEQRTIQVTVTLGGCTAAKNDTAERLLARSDRLMYQGKAAGRNRVVVSGL